MRVSMFTSCGGVGQAGVAAVRHTLQLYKSLMRPASLKSALLEQHKSFTHRCIPSRCLLRNLGAAQPKFLPSNAHAGARCRPLRNELKTGKLCSS